MNVEYAWRGLLGVLTPQANTTVEPEFTVLMPPGIACLAARMVHDAPDMHDRLRAYLRDITATSGQFANAPLGAIAFACTGSSYLTPPEQEAELVAATQAARGVPVITSARAILDALAALQARRIALVSPYPPALTEASIAFWRAAGHEIARVELVTADPGAFHPVYALSATAAAAALQRLEQDRGFHAVVMLGTGMPTLGPILAHPRISGAPVLSSQLATAWRSVLALQGGAPSAENLLAWIENPAWSARYRATRPPA